MIESTAMKSRPVLLPALVAALLIVGASLLARQFERGSPARIASALLQGAATAWAVILPVRSVRALDEMQHRIPTRVCFRVRRWR